MVVVVVVFVVDVEKARPRVSRVSACSWRLVRSSGRTGLEGASAWKKTRSVSSYAPVTSLSRVRRFWSCRSLGLGGDVWGATATSMIIMARTSRGMVRRDGGGIFLFSLHVLLPSYSTLSRVCGLSWVVVNKTGVVKWRSRRRCAEDWSGGLLFACMREDLNKSW